MKDIIFTHLQKTQAVTFATCEGDQPRLRPMTLIVKDNRLFFATGSTDSKSQQLGANPKAEFCLNISNDTNNGYLRGSGIMQLVTEQATRKEIAEWSGFIYNYWKESTNPDYCLYELILQQTRFMAPGAMYETLNEWL